MSSEYEYLSSMIEIAKEMQDDYSKYDDSKTQNKCYNLINSGDLKQAKSFQYNFKIPFRELCKNSKRCTTLLVTSTDMDYINILKLPEIKHTASNIKAPLNNMSNNYANNLSQNIVSIGDSLTPFHFSKTMLTSSLKKRIASTSTPQSMIVNKMSAKILPTPITNQIQSANKEVDSKPRVLTSSLKMSKNITNSVAKSVKFQLNIYTREISSENTEFNDCEDEIEQPSAEDPLAEKNDTEAVERKQLFVEEEADEEEEMEDVVIENENETQVPQENDNKKTTTAEVTLSESVDMNLELNKTSSSSGSLDQSET